MMPAWFGTFFLNNGLLAPFFLLIVLTLALDNTRISKLMSHPWLVLLGDASYALYILHVPVRWLFERGLALTGIALPYTTMYTIYLPIMIVLSVLTFIYIERPARDWLRQNMRKLPLILLDLVLIAGAVWVSFALALGGNVGSYARTETFATRIGLTVFFVALLIFRYYASGSWRSLIFASALGSLTLAGFMILAASAGWVEGLPRAALLLTVTLIFVFIFSSRFLIRRWKPALLS
jgi:peptidoglycan/LPS O-acetylase OafA/YrhL